MSAPSELPDAGRHLGEFAELHALGALESLERAQVEAHVATCARALGIAEATVAALEDTYVPQLEPPERLRLRIASSHFNHVAFIAREAYAPISKVLYARDGAWFYVVIDSATCNCHVVARSAAGDERDIGTPEVRGSTATLFTRDFPRPTLLKLVDASGRVISGAALPYPAK